MARRKAAKKVVHRPLTEFYSPEQLEHESHEKRRKEHEKVEMEIFEHLKEHTKKVLRDKNK